MLRLPACMGCGADRADCYWEISEPSRTLYVKLYAVAFPRSFEGGGENMGGGDEPESRITWFAHSEAVVVKREWE